MSGRKRIGSWDEVEAALAELARLERSLETVEKERARAELRAREWAEPMEEKRAALLRSVERFCRAHTCEFTSTDGRARRSRQLACGRVGFRRTQAVAVSNEARAVEALNRSAGTRPFLRVWAELDRESLRQFLLAWRGKAKKRSKQDGVARQLEKAGIGLERRESWFYELAPGARRRRG